MLLPFLEGLHKLWTKGYLEFNFQLFLFLAAGISFINFGAGLITYIKSINDLFSQTVIIFTRVILIFLFSYIFIAQLGMAVVGLGIFISKVISSVILPLYFVNKIIESFSVYFNPQLIFLLLLPPFVSSAISLIYLGGFEKIVILSLFSLLAEIIIYIFIWHKLNIEFKNMLKSVLLNLFINNWIKN